MLLTSLLEQFNEDEYDNTENIDLINKFIEKYSIIEKEDVIKPRFSLTRKYNAYKSRKKQYNKKKTVWKKFNPETNIKKIESKIRANLNKMNDDVYIEIFKI